jgi:L-lysine exporter family protein LysE/ArgO
VLDVVISGLALGLAIGLPVGPVITEIIRRGLRAGFREAWLVGLGAAASHAILVTLTLLGVVTFLDWPILHLLLGAAGIAVLGYLGVDALRIGTNLPVMVGVGEFGRPFVVGFSIGIANPISLLWFLTVGGALMAGHSGGRMGTLAVAFGASFVAGVLAWDTVVAALSGMGRRWMGPRTMRCLNGVAAAVFFGFAVRLAWQLIGLLR